MCFLVNFFIIFNVVFSSIRMLKYFHIKQNADLIKSFYAFGVFENASELQDESVEEIQVDEIEYGRLRPMIVVVKIIITLLK